MTDLSNIIFFKSFYLGLEGDRTLVPHPKLAKKTDTQTVLASISMIVEFLFLGFSFPMA